MSYKNGISLELPECCGDLVQILLIQMWYWSKSKSNAVCLFPCSFPVSWPAVIQVQGWVLLSSCNRGRLLVDARLIYVKQKVFLPKVWLCTLKTHGSRLQPWFTAVIFPKYWACFPCKSSILMLATLTINSKWNSGPVCLLLKKEKKKENSWNLK